MPRSSKDPSVKILSVRLPIAVYERLRSIAVGGKVKLSMQKAGEFAIGYCLDRVGDAAAFDLSDGQAPNNSTKAIKKTPGGPGRTKRDRRAGT